ncbi:MAG: acyl-ACP desaturase [Lentisphaeraceae bacterium]|nr:acyl-ACP desaturase [Lentisphaeraceae bacterium]
MIFQVLEDGRIWIQFILVDGNAEEKFRYSDVLSKYGTYKYIDSEIIEFVSDLPKQSLNREKARDYVMKLNQELQIADLIER